MKTTQSQFKVFDKATKHFISLYGLKSWEIDTRLGECSSSTSIADCEWDCVNRCATITLNKDYDPNIYKLNNYYLKKYALHEINHILMAPIHDKLRECKVHEDIILELVHTVSGILENILIDEREK